VLASLIPTVNIMDTEVHVKDVWQGDSWNFGSLATSIPDDDLKFRIIANPIPSSTYNIRGLSVWQSSVFRVNTKHHWLTLVYSSLLEGLFDG